jgi:hypothetical protein
LAAAIAIVTVIENGMSDTRPTSVLTQPAAARAKIDPILPPVGGFFRDSQPLDDARFSSQEVNRFFGIAPITPPAAKLARNAAHLPNVFCDAVLKVSIVADARHLPFR